MYDKDIRSTQTHPLLCGTWLIHMWPKNNSHMNRDSSQCCARAYWMQKSSSIHKWDMTPSYVIWEWTINESHMGWLRSVGSIKSQVSFAEYRLFYRSLLQKRPIISSIQLTKATPYDLSQRCALAYWIKKHCVSLLCNPASSPTPCLIVARSIFIPIYI